MPFFIKKTWTATMIRLLLEKNFPTLFTPLRQMPEIKPSTKTEAVYVDVHSHLLPDLDEGADCLEISFLIIKELVKMGYQKLILTPHIMAEFYPNSPKRIRETLQQLNDFVKRNGVLISLEVAAEYYLDDSFVKMLLTNQELLTFGTPNEKPFLLFETSLVNEPHALFEAIKRIQLRGLKPILAHPERYIYLQHNYEKIHELHEAGVLFQVNINSFSGYYAKAAQELAEYLSVAQMISFVATDCHNLQQVQSIKKSITSFTYQTTLKSGTVLNNLLL